MTVLYNQGGRHGLFTRIPRIKTLQFLNAEIRRLAATPSRRTNCCLLTCLACNDSDSWNNLFVYVFLEDVPPIFFCVCFQARRPHASHMPSPVPAPLEQNTPLRFLPLILHRQCLSERSTILGPQPGLGCALSGNTSPADLAVNTASPGAPGGSA